MADSKMTAVLTIVVGLIVIAAIVVASVRRSSRRQRGESADPWEKGSWIVAVCMPVVVAIGSLLSGSWSGNETAPLGKGGGGMSATTAVETPMSGNYRCGRIRYLGPVKWTPCTRDAGDNLQFMLQMTNTGDSPITVKAKLAYVAFGEERPCPGPWGEGLLVTVSPHADAASPADACTAHKQPMVFQTKAWVAGKDDDSWGYREMSKSAHVQADGRTVVWGE